MAVFAVLLGMFLLVAGALPATASHFRSGTVSWSPTGTPGQVEFKVTVAYRRDAFGGRGADGFAITGDDISETGFDFGDGTGTGDLDYRVVAFSAPENYIVVEALDPVTGTPGVLHTYSGPGPFIAKIEDCCRISNLNNRADGDYRLETTVTPQGTNRSPVAIIVPTVRVVARSAGTPARFLVPASDPDLDRIRFRLSSDAEAGGGPPPPGLTIDAVTGEISWLNDGLNQTDPFTVQVIVEDLDANGNVKSTIPVDFLLRIGALVGNEPTLTITQQGSTAPPSFCVAPGTPLSFKVTGFDVDANDSVTLNTAGGLPPGATLTPDLPLTGNTGVNTTFNFTPTQAQLGKQFILLFVATDNAGQQALKSVTITVKTGTTGCGGGNITNRAPVAVNDTFPISPDKIFAGTANNVLDILANDSDPDGDRISIVFFRDPVDPTVPTASGKASQGGFLTISGTAILYTPKAGFVGTETFTYSIQDTKGAVSNPATVTVTVVAKPTPPPPPPPPNTAGASVKGRHIPGADIITGKDARQFDIEVATEKNKAGKPLTFKKQKMVFRSGTLAKYLEIQATSITQFVVDPAPGFGGYKTAVIKGLATVTVYNRALGNKQPKPVPNLPFTVNVTDYPTGSANNDVFTIDYQLLFNFTTTVAVSSSDITIEVK